MKQAAISQASPSGTGTQDFTDATFASDCKLGIFVATAATANATSTANSALAIGMTDKTAIAAFGWSANDAQGTATVARSRQSASHAIGMTDPSGNWLLEADITGVSHPATGLQLTWDNVNSQELVGALLIGGSDIEASVVYADLTTVAYTNVSVSHGLGGAPDAFIVVSNHDAASSSLTSSRGSIGFFDGTNAACVAHYIAGAQATTTNATYVSNAYCGVRIGPGFAYGVTISSVGATTFLVSANNAPSANARWQIIAIRGLSDAKAGVFQVPASTGDSQVISGMSTAPSVLLMSGSRYATLNASGQSSEAGHISFGCAVNNGGTTQQFAAVATSDDGVTLGSSVEKSYFANNKALLIREENGAELATATVATWEADGVTLNFSAVEANDYVAYLAIGAAGTKYLKLLAESAAASATGVEVVVHSAPSGSNYVTGTTRYGSASGQEFEASLESGQAVLKVLASDVGCSALAADTVVSACARNTTYTTGMVSATIIEE